MNNVGMVVFYRYLRLAPEAHTNKSLFIKITCPAIATYNRYVEINKETIQVTWIKRKLEEFQSLEPAYAIDIL